MEETIIQTQEPEKKELSPFGNNAWTENLPEVKQEESLPIVVNEQPATEQKPTDLPNIKNEQEEEILEPAEWLKRELGIEDIAILKSEREEYAKLKGQTPAEIKFENDQSKQIYELLKEGKGKEVKQFLETQERLEQFTTADVTKETADDIIKMGMQLKYKDLTPKEIEYKFNKEFSIPKAPVQQADELDEEFEQRKSEWQERVTDIETNKIIEAKLSRPELEKAKAQLVLPELSKPKVEQANELDPKVLEKARETFLTALDSDYSKVEGFTTKVKDELVELPVSFKIPEEDKVAIKNRLQEGFDLNAFIDNRWFDANGNPKVQQMISDIYTLENPDKILSGIANNAANQRLVEHRKQASNIDVSGNNTSQQTFSQQSGQAKSPFAKDAWSEKPPVLTN